MELTSPDKVLFPEAGVTKGDLARYYARVEDVIGPHLERRIVSLVRCPDGVAGDCFFQRHPMEGMPTSIGSIEVQGKTGKKIYLYVDLPDGLRGLVQLSTIECHIWGTPMDRPDNSDRLVFDLDPGQGAEFEVVKRGALVVRDQLQSVGLRSFSLLTGSKGVHVVSPLSGAHRWEQVKSFARALASRIASESPDHFTVKSSKDARKGRVFIDYLRNDHSQTAIAPYSPRAHASAPVACPIRWDELVETERSAAYDIHSLPRRLASLGECPWANYFELKQTITAEMLETVGAK